MAFGYAYDHSQSGESYITLAELPPDEVNAALEVHPRNVIAHEL